MKWSEVDAFVKAAIQEIDGGLASAEAVLHTSFTSESALKSAVSKFVLAGLITGS